MRKLTASARGRNVESTRGRTPVFCEFLFFQNWLLDGMELWALQRTQPPPSTTSFCVLSPRRNSPLAPPLGHYPEYLPPFVLQIDHLSWFFHVSRGFFGPDQEPSTGIAPCNPPFDPRHLIPQHCKRSYGSIPTNSTHSHTPAPTSIKPLLDPERSLAQS